ncbi:hypothetical protein P3T23_009592 [Paraburkholderia sp. GAS448]|uniref:hypothetical protein n=1 Tax=Paraburkholderia sp. GAS448 TaxID=3035136 RepID=UPI003D254AFE
MRKSALLIVSLLAMVCARADVLSPASVAGQIDRLGADQAVHQLVASGEYDRVLNHIQNGNGRWIALAPRLAPGTDAGTAEDLGIALAYALPENPEAVLSVIDGKDGPVIGVSRVCGVPFIEGTIGDVHAYTERAVAAVSRADRPDLAHVRLACLDALQR